jgi:phospholipase/lecithinase/hemolysin
VLNYAHTLQYKDRQLGPNALNYSICATPDTYLFWDEIHPNTRAHYYMATEACENLKAHGFEAQCTSPAVKL